MPISQDTEIQQAIEVLRQARAEGHYVDWDHETDMPDLVGAAGIAVEAWMSWAVIDALSLLGRRLSAQSGL